MKLRNMLGSPPQVRGKLIVFFLSNAYTRITPAGAGKTCRGKYINRRIQDHPRRCGENYIHGNIIWNLQGSPPQVRGKLGQNANGVPLIRITPAGAGKTDGLYTNAFLHWDHPRRCGENNPVLPIV